MSIIEETNISTNPENDEKDTNPQSNKPEQLPNHESPQDSTESKHESSQSTSAQESQNLNTDANKEISIENNSENKTSETTQKSDTTNETMNPHEFFPNEDDFEKQVISHQKIEDHVKPKTIDEEDIKWSIPSEKDIFVQKLEKRLELVKSSGGKTSSKHKTEDEISFEPSEHEIHEKAPLVDEEETEFNPPINVKRGISKRKFYSLTDDQPFKSTKKDEKSDGEDLSEDEQETKCFTFLYSWLYNLCCRSSQNAFSDDEEMKEYMQRLE